MVSLLTKGQVCGSYEHPSWQRVVFAEFESTLTSKSRPFPCVFGVSGLKGDQLRYSFLDPLEPETVAPVLAEYLAGARDIGRMTSLVVFGRPGPVQGIEAYRDRFWSILDGLSALDEGPQPEGVSRDLDDPTWEFTFAGEPVFVVCNSPAHVMRQSRRSTSFMITFQPRWVFDGITDSDDPAVKKALKIVRDRIREFDAIEESPFLGSYGQFENREYQQYFLDDTNEAPRCPFHQLGRRLVETPEKEGKVA